MKHFKLAMEILGLVCAVGSLIFLGLQIQDQTRAVRSAMANDTVVAMQSWYIEMGSNDQAGQVWLKGLSQPESLTANETFQFVMMTHAAFLALQNGFFFTQEGTLDSEISESISTGIIAIKGMPGTELYWRLRRDFFQPEFRDYVEQLFQDSTIETLEIYRSLLPAEGPDTETVRQ